VKAAVQTCITERKPFIFEPLQQEDMTINNTYFYFYYFFGAPAGL